MSGAPPAAAAHSTEAASTPWPATVLLSGSDIRRLVTITDAIEVTQQAAREQAAGPLSAAPRVGLPGGGTLLMAAASADRGGVAGKIVSIAPENRGAGLATIQGLACWFDYTTRRPLLIADATAVTALRTGALSGVATRALAPPGASVLAMIGSGGQALTQIQAVAAVRPIKHVRVASLHRESAERIGEQLGTVLPDLDVCICEGLARAVAEADIVCLATTARSALIEAGDLSPEVHVNAAGAYRPDMREVGTSVFAAATLVCSDDAAGALREAGDLMDAVAAGVLPPASVTELGALPGLGAGPPAGRRGVTVFKSVGSAAADLAVLDLLFRRATAEPDIPGFDFAG